MSENSDQMLYLIRTLDLLNLFFNGNEQKTAMWMVTENPNLGGAKPIVFFLKYRGHKVHNFVQSRINESLCPHDKMTFNGQERCFQCHPNIGLKEGEE